MREGERNPRNGEEGKVDGEIFILQQGMGKLLELLQWRALPHFGDG
jgi:hypothetical protein